jgi:hypothetical protein
LELIERIGSGGYGEVWLCRNVMGTLRAVKIGTVTVRISAIIFMAGLIYLASSRLKSADSTKPGPAWQTDGAVSEVAWQTRMRGTQMINPYTVSSISNAVVEFERAVELDPNYAKVWGLMAMAHILAVDFGYVPATNFLPLARLRAQRAIDLNFSYGYMPLALAKLGMDFDFDSMSLCSERPSSWTQTNGQSAQIFHGTWFIRADLPKPSNC